MNMRTKNEVTVYETSFSNDDILKYERLVYYFINLFPQNAVCDEEDLYQEGVLAIYNAMESYDPSKRASMSTWISNCVKWALFEYYKKNFYPLSKGSYLYQWMDKAGENPSVEKLMKMGASRSVALAITYYRLMPSQYGTEFNMADPKSKKMLDYVLNTATPFDYTKYLSDQEYRVIKYYFGLNGDEPHTMEEIAKMIGKSRHAVSGSLRRALVKLKHTDITAYIG